jgi:non-canonical purine NTP pyrophosphatase (RdgB/HAM1 family)
MRCSRLAQLPELSVCRWLPTIPESRSTRWAAVPVRLRPHIAPTDEANLKELIRAVAGVPAGGRTARYRCVAVAAWPDGRHLETDATCEGTLLAKPRGEGGFGYDPIFVPAGWDDTMAQISAEEKDRISHRGRAFRALGELIAGSRA